MDRYTTSLYLALFNMAASGLVAVGWAYGMVGPIFADDVSRITWIVAALLVGVLAYATAQTFRLDRMDRHDDAAIESAMAWPIFLKGRIFFNLGLCATLVGLIMFVSHMATDASAASSEAIAGTLNAMKHSMSTAFNGTLVGVVAKVWTEVVVFIQGWSVRRLRSEPRSVVDGIAFHAPSPNTLTRDASDEQLRALITAEIAAGHA